MTFPAAAQAATSVKVKFVSTFNTWYLDDVKIMPAASSPTITATPTAVTGVSRVYNTDTATAKSFTVTGTDLGANITVTPSSDFEVCDTEDGTYANSVTITKSGTSASGTVFVRPKKTASVGCKSDGYVTLSSSGAANVRVDVSGVVTPAVGVSASSAGGTFTWSSVAGATGYQLSIWSGSGGAGYTRVEGLTDGVLPDGDYVILDKDHDAIMAQKVSGQKYYGYSSPVFSETTLEATCIGNANIWTFVKSGSYYSIQNKGNSKYVTCSSASNNNMGEADTATTVWAISMVDGNFRIKPSTLETSLQWNGSYTRFSNYANSGQDDLHLYKLGCAAGTIDGGASQPLGGVSVSSGVVVGGLEAETTYNYSLTVVGVSCDMVTTGTFTTTALSGSLTVSGETGLTEMKTTAGHAGATPGSFAVRGANLTERVRVQVPAGFAVSLSENSGYSADGGYVDIQKTTAEAGNTTVYVRLTGGAVASGTQNVTVSSSGASTVNVEVSGTTYAAPGLSSHSGSATPTVGGENVSVNVSGLKTGSGAMTYSLTAPEGLASGSDYTWNSANGTVTFVPHKAGTYTFTVTVKNAAEDTYGTETYTWTVTASHPAGTASGGTTVQFPGTWNSYATALTTVQDTKFGNGDYYHTPALYFTGDEWFKTWRNSTYYSRGYFDQSEGYWLAANLSGHVLDTWNKNGDNIKLCVTETGGGFTPTGAGYYTFRGYYNSGEDKVYCVAMFTAERPVTVSSASDNHATAGTGNVTVTANLSGTPSTETVYLRYAVNGDWKTPVPMTGSGATRTGTIPGQTGDKTVQWYIFTSPHGAATSNPDLCTLEGLKSGTTNFAYVPMSLTASPAMVSGLTTVLGTKGAVQDVTVAGTGLSSTIAVSLSGSGVEVSLDGGSTWKTSSSVGTLPAAGGTLKVRMAGTSVGSPSATVTLTSGSYNATVSVSGTVNALPNPVPGTPTTDVEHHKGWVGLTWAKSGGYDVMLVRYGPDATSPAAPSQGTGYSQGGTFGSGVNQGTVLYVGGDRTSGTAKSLEEGKTYTFKFYSVNNNYYSSGATVTATTPSLPTAASLSVGSATPSSLTLTITRGNGTSVKVYRFGSSPSATTQSGAASEGTLVYDGSGTTVVDNNGGTGLTGCTTYYYQAWEYDGYDYAATCGSGNGKTTLAAPVADGEYDTGSGTVTVTWGAVSGASSYLVQVASDEFFTTSTPGGTTPLVENNTHTESVPDGWTYSSGITYGGGNSKYPLLTHSGDYIQSPSISVADITALSITFKLRTYGSPSSAEATTTVTLCDASTGNEIVHTTYEPTTSSMVLQSAWNISASTYSGHSSVYVKWQNNDASSNRGAGIQDITISGTGTGVPGSIKDSGTVSSAPWQFVASGLAAADSYFYRVKAISTGECEEWSEIGEAVSGPKVTLSGEVAAESTAGYAGAAETITVSGSHLEGAVTVTAPIGWQVYDTANSDWRGSTVLTPTAGTLAATTVQLRLGSGLAVGSYDVYVTATSTGADTASLEVLGQVYPMPTIKANPVMTATVVLGGTPDDATLEATDYLTATDSSFRYTLAVSPSDLSDSLYDFDTGEIYFTPDDTGRWTFTVTVESHTGETVTHAWTVTVTTPGGCERHGVGGPATGNFSSGLLPGNIYTYTVGDLLSYVFYGAMNFDFNTDEWTVDYGVGKSSDVTDAGWIWHTAARNSLEGGVNRWWGSVANQVRFDSAGTWYAAMRFRKGGCVYYAATGTWGDQDGDATPTATSHFTVNAIAAPTAATCASDANDTGKLSLGWTENAAADPVMVVRYPNNNSQVTEPVQGETYEEGDPLGVGTVVYKGTDEAFVDTGLTAGHTYKYRLYSVHNGAYYSAPTPLNGQSPTAPSVSISGTTDFGTLAPDGTATTTLTISNTGNGVFNISGISFTGAGAAMFSVVGDGPTSVAAQANGTPGTATVTVRYTPSAQGTHTATLTLATTQSGVSAATASLTGACACFAGDSMGEVTATVSGTTATLTWDAVTAATGYLLKVWTGGAAYQQVEGSAPVADGDYVIASGSDSAIVGSFSTGNGYYTSVSAAANASGVLTTPATVANTSVWTIENQGTYYTIKNKTSGKYLTCTSNSGTGLGEGSDATAAGAKWTLTMANGVLTARSQNQTTRYLLHNSTYGRFGSYTGSSSDVEAGLHLFKKDLTWHATYGENGSAAPSGVTLSGLTESTTYHFTVTAQGAGGCTSETTDSFYVGLDDTLRDVAIANYDAAGASAGANVAAGSVAAGQTVLLQGTKFTVSSAQGSGNPVLTDVSFALGGTAVAADVTGYRVRLTDSGTWTGEGGTTWNATLSEGTLSASGSYTMNAPGTYYAWIEAVTAGGATGGHTLSVGALTADAFTMTGARKTGGTTAAGAQTIGNLTSFSAAQGASAGGQIDLTWATGAGGAVLVRWSTADNIPEPGTAWEGKETTLAAGTASPHSLEMPLGCQSYYLKAWEVVGGVACGGIRTAGPVAASAPGTPTIGTPGYTGLNAHGATLVWGAAAGAASYSVNVVHYVGGGGAKTVVFTPSSSSTGTLSGDVPDGASATFANSYSSAAQITKDNTMTLTLRGFGGKRITGLTLRASSNSSSGGGGMTMTSGGTTLASIPDSKFNAGYWHTDWSNPYMNVSPTVTATTIGAGNDLVITISASESSLYVNKFTIDYETGTPVDDVIANVPQTVGGVTRTFTLDGLTGTVGALGENTTYSWSVTALGAGGCEGGTATGSFTTPELVGAPTLTVAATTDGATPVGGALDVTVEGVTAGATVVVKRYGSVADALADANGREVFNQVVAGTSRTFTDNTGLAGCTPYWYVAWQTVTLPGEGVTTSAPSTATAGTTTLKAPVVNVAGAGTSLTLGSDGVAGATKYVVEVATDTLFTAPVTGSALSEDFAGLPSGDAAVAGSEDSYMADEGWKVTYSYSKTLDGNRCLRVGTDNNPGTAITPEVSTPNGGTLTFKLRKYGSDGGTVSVSWSKTKAAGSWTTLRSGIAPGASFEEYSMGLPEESGYYIKWETSKKRTYLDDVAVAADTVDDDDASLLLKVENTSVPWETTVGDLTPGTPYYWRVTVSGSGEGCADVVVGPTEVMTVDAPLVAVWPERGEYGTLDRDESLEKTFTVRNSGSRLNPATVPALEITGIAVVQTGTDYRITEGAVTSGTVSLAPGGTRTVKVEFAPTTDGPKNAVLRITCNAWNADPDRVVEAGKTFDVPLEGICHDPSTEPPTVYELSVTDGAGRKNTVTDHAMARGAGPDPAVELPGASAVQLSVLAWHYNKMYSGDVAAKQATWTLKKDGTVVSDKGGTRLTGRPFSGRATVTASNGKECTRYTAVIPALGAGNAEEGEYTVEFTAWDSTGEHGVSAVTAFTPPEKGWLLDDFTRGDRSATDAGGLGRGWTVSATDAASGGTGSAVIHGQQLELYGPNGTMSGADGRIAVVRDMDDWGYGKLVDSMESTLSWGFHFRTGAKTGAANGSSATAGLFVLGATGSDWLGSGASGASGYAVALADNKVSLVQFGAGLKAGSTITTLKPAGAGNTWAYEGTTGKTLAVRVDFAPGQEAIAGVQEAVAPKLRLFVKETAETGGNPLEECSDGDKVCEVELADAPAGELRYAGMVWSHGKAQLGDKTGGMFDDIHMPCEKAQEIPMVFEVVDEDTDAPEFDGFRMAVTAASDAAATWVGMANAIQASGAYNNGLTVTGVVHDASGIWADGEGTAPVWELYVADPGDETWGDPEATGTPELRPAGSGAGADVAMRITIGTHVLPNTAGKDVLLVVEACDHDHDRAGDSLWGGEEFEFTLCSETPSAPAWATVERDGAEMAVLRWAHAVHQTNLVVRSDTPIEPHATPVQGLGVDDCEEGTELEGLGEVVYFGEGEAHLSGTWTAQEVVVEPGSTNYFAVFGVNSDPTGCYFSEPTFPSDWSWKENGSVVYATGTGAANGTPCAPSAMDPARDAVRSNSWPMTTLVYEPGEGIDAFAYRTKVTAPGDGDPAGKAVLFNAEERDEMGSGWGGVWTENAAGTWKIHDTSLPVGETDYPEPAGNKLYWQDASGSEAGLARMERTLESPARGDFFVAALVNYQYRGDGKWLNIVLLDESDNVIVSFGKQGGAGVSANAAILVPQRFSGQSNGDQTKSVPEYNTSQPTFQLAPEQDATAAGYIGNDYVIVGQVSKSENRFRMWAYYAGPIPETPNNAQKAAAMGRSYDAATRADMLARAQIPQIFADPAGGPCATNSVVASWYLDGLGGMVGNVAKIRLEAGSNAGSGVLGHVYFDEVRFGSRWDELFLFDDPEVYNFSFERQNGEDEEGRPKWQVSDGALAHGKVALTATFDLYHRTGIQSADFTIMNSNKVALLQTAATPTPSSPGDYATGTASDPVGMSSEESGSAGRSQWTLRAEDVALPTNWISLDSNYVVQVHLTTAGGKENTVTSATESGGAGADELFFGEYGENTGQANYLEIYNGTGRTVDLSDYWIGKLENVSDLNDIKDRFDAARTSGWATRSSAGRIGAGNVKVLDGDTVGNLTSGVNEAWPFGPFQLPHGTTVCILPQTTESQEIPFIKALLGAGCRVICIASTPMQVSGDDPQVLMYKEGATDKSQLTDCEWIDMAGVAKDLDEEYIMYRLESTAEVPRRYPKVVDMDEWNFRPWTSADKEGEHAWENLLSTAGKYDTTLGLGGNMEFTVYDDDVLAPELSGEDGANGMEMRAESGLLPTTAGTRDLVMAAWSFTNTESVALASNVWSGSAMKDNAKLTCSANLGTIGRLVDNRDNQGVTGAEFNGVYQNKAGTLYFKCNDAGYNITKEDEAWIGFETDMASATERGVSFWYATGDNGFKEGHVEVSLNGVDWWMPDGWGLELDDKSGTGGPTEFIEFSKSLEFTTDDGVTLAIPRTTPHLWFRVEVSQRKDADGSFRLDSIQVHGVADELVVTDQQLVGAQPVFHAKVRDASGVDTVSATFKSGLEGVEGAGAAADKNSSESGAYTNFTWALAAPLGTDQVQKWFEASEEGQTHLTVSVKDKDDDRPDDQSELDGHFGALRVMDDDDEAPEIKMTSMKPRMGGVLGEWYADETNGVATVGLPARHANGIAASAIQARAGNEVPKPVKWSAYGDGTYGYRQTGWQADSKYWYVRLETLVPTAESGSEGGATFTITNITFWTKSSRTGPTGCIASFVAGFTGTDALDRPTGGTTSEIGTLGFLGEGAEGWTESTADTWAKQTIPLMGGDAIVLGGTTKNELQLLGQGAEKMAGAWHIYDLRIEGTVRYANGESEEVTYVTDHGLATGATLGSLQGNIWDASGLASATYTLKKGTSTLVPESDLTFTGGNGSQEERRAGATTEEAGAFSVSLSDIRAGYADLELGDYLGTVKAEDADTDRTVTTAVASGTGRRDGTVTENVDSMSIEGDFGFTVVDQDVKGPDTPAVATGDAQTKGVYATRPASGATVHWTNNPVFAVVLAGEAVDAAPTSAETDGTTEAGRTWRSEHGWQDTVQNGTSGIAEYRVSTDDLAAAENYAASNTIQKAAGGFGARGLANGGFEGAGGFGVDGGWIVTNSNDKIDTGSHHGDKGTRSLSVGNNRKVRQILAFSNANHRTVTVSGGMWYRKNTDNSRAHMVVEAYADPRETTGTPVGTIDSGALGNNVAAETWTEYTFGPLSIGDGSVNCLVVTLYSTGAANRFDDVELTLDLGEGTQPAVAYVATAAGQGLDVAKWLFAVDADDDRVDDAEMGQAVPFFTAYDCTPPTPVAFKSHSNGASTDHVDDPTTQFDLTWTTSGVGPDDTESDEYAAMPAANKRGVHSLSPWGTFRVYYRTYDPVALEAAATEAKASSTAEYLYQTLVRGPADGWGGSGEETAFYKDASLGWKHVENGSEIEDTTATVSAEVVDGKRKYCGWNVIGTGSQQTVRLYDLDFDQEYVVVVVGVDKAGNEGPVNANSWTTNNTIKFSITRGWHVPKTEAVQAFSGIEGLENIGKRLTNSVVSALKWTAAELVTTNEMVVDDETVQVVTTNVTKDYDLLQWDARSFRESPDNEWKLLQTVKTNWFVDDGGPTQRGDIRFYRASYKDRWKKAVTNKVDGTDVVTAQTPLVSEEVYAQTAVRLRPEQNFTALHGVPYTNTFRGVFGGLDEFPGGTKAADSTVIDFYEPNATETKTESYWLHQSGNWLLEGGDGKPVNDIVQDRNFFTRAFSIQLPNTIPDKYVAGVQTNMHGSKPEEVPYLLWKPIAQVPTNGFSRVVECGTAKAPKYNIVALRLPVATHPSKMNLIESGFAQGYPWEADQIYTIDTLTREPGHSCYCDPEGNWQYVAGGNVPWDYFKPNDVLVIVSKNKPFGVETSTSTSWTWTYDPKKFYTLPNRHMQAE